MTTTKRRSRQSRPSRSRHGNSTGSAPRPLQFYAFDPEKKLAWKFRASTAWYRRHDNGVAVSIGFSVPRDLTVKQLKALGAKEVNYETWKHSGCQSGCVLRGDKECRW